MYINFDNYKLCYFALRYRGAFIASNTLLVYKPVLIWNSLVDNTGRPEPPMKVMHMKDRLSTPERIFEPKPETEAQ